MTRAANRLHISQSAVSRRIKALENEVGRKLIEKSGRQAVFTQHGARLLERMRPLVAGTSTLDTSLAVSAVTRKANSVVRRLITRLVSVDGVRFKSRTDTTRSTSLIVGLTKVSSHST